MSSSFGADSPADKLIRREWRGNYFPRENQDEKGTRAGKRSGSKIPVDARVSNGTRQPTRFTRQKPGHRRLLTCRSTTVFSPRRDERQIVPRDSSFPPVRNSERGARLQVFVKTKRPGTSFTHSGGRSRYTRDSEKIRGTPKVQPMTDEGGNYHGVVHNIDNISDTNARSVLPSKCTFQRSSINLSQAEFSSRPKL